MRKTQKNEIVKEILKKAGDAAGKLKAAIKDFLIKVNPGP